MLEAVRHERDRELVELAVVWQHLVHDHLAQPRGRQVARVDGDVGAILQRLEQQALLRDRARHLAAARERMPPARLLVAVEQHVLARLEEEQAVRSARRREVLEHLRQSLEVGAAAHVAHDRRALDLAALVGEQLGQRGDHLGRQVVDAEVAGVLEARHRLGLARAGEARDHHEVVDRAAVPLILPREATTTHALPHLRHQRILFTYSYTSRATFPGTPGTASSSSLVASRKRSGVPKWLSKSRLRAGPTPGSSSSTERVIALSRRPRWNSIAKRWASSRARWRSCRPGVSCGRRSGERSPGTNTSSMRLARLTTVTPRSRNGPSSFRPAESWPRPPSITISAGSEAKLSSYSLSCGLRSRCATYCAIRRESTSAMAAKSS